MTAKEIFEELLAGKSLTLSFTSMSDVRSFKSSLQVYKYRANKLNRDLGIEPSDILEGDSICADVIESPDPRIIDIKFYVGRKVTQEAKFKIVSIS
jgi:hypothetical protein